MPNAFTPCSRIPRCRPGRSGAKPALVALLALVGCANHYEYTFHVTEPSVPLAPLPGQPELVDDADVTAGILVDGAAGVVRLDVTNKTDQVLEVAWTEIALTRPDGTAMPLRPDADLGWIEPGAKQSARLFPIALPHSGSAALANQDRRFQLDVPVIVRREAKIYHFTLTAQLREL
jgi:hypothetical protein